MKTTFRKKVRLLALAALVAALPLAMSACDDADSTDGPTGPATQYNPQMDYADAKITARSENTRPAPGETFTIIVAFTDANGLPVNGVPLVISAEEGGAGGYFSYETNPTLTGESGRASIGVVVSAGCPNGSYRFIIAPLRGAQVRGYVGIEVSGVGASASVTRVDLSVSPSPYYVGNTVTFTATPVATTGCNVRYQFNAAGAGLNTGWADAADPTNDVFTQVPSATGALSFRVRGYCTGGTTMTLSNEINISVTTAP